MDWTQVRPPRQPVRPPRETYQYFGGMPVYRIHPMIPTTSLWGSADVAGETGVPS